MAAALALAEVQQALTWIGFGNQGQQDTICEEAGLDIDDAEEFKQLLNSSIQRAALRKVENDQVGTISKAANLGKFQDERKWLDWEPALVNYLSTISGSYHIPLSYVVRENEDPAHDRDFNEDFQAEMTTHALLHGAHFRADARRVHQVLKNFLVSETAEQWIKSWSTSEMEGEI